MNQKPPAYVVALSPSTCHVYFLFRKTWESGMADVNGILQGTSQHIAGHHKNKLNILEYGLS